ncbi:CoA transferase [Streptomyces hirsutus]|uniref:CoA transferase n=1 Tax=Streptomyces hirsutus TaxID=35620 RepID=A0ABZ1GUF4_9ACTN|nr:CoA transferase [Streptomyces hirsutus]WSD09744.1 CoA transferase [Streptomyces hirsutus]WTD16875.1 CoA transferase [Streptomyces hirsutus]WTD78201.1 CoA transferase [Streptomyces sp. NBC_01635]
MVVDLSRALAGPQATMMLADLGARVIKVESPDGDDSRHWGPPFVGDDGISTYFLSCNRNKESVTANLKSEEGRSFLTALLQVADVLVENFRPGVLERLGFGEQRLRELNPRLVICSLTGFGHDGPEWQRAGYDQIAQGEAGLMSLTGPAGEPTKVGVPIGDLLAGMNGAYGIVAALFERERTGRGRVVRASLLSSIVGAHAFQGTRYTVAGQVPTGEGNHHPSIAPYGIFRTADVSIQIACGNDAIWRRLCQVLDLFVEDPRFASNQLRVQHRDRVTAVLETVLRGAPADHWLKLLEHAGVPAGRVRTLDEVYAWDQTRSQGLLVEVDHPTLGPVELPGPALRFDDNPYAGAREHHTHPPLLGEHDDSVRAWLGLTSAALDPGDKPWASTRPA